MTSEIQKQFYLTSKIGNGNFSTVYLAKHISTQQIVAVKTMVNHLPIAIKQAQILKKINHPNIIKIYQFEKPKHKEQVMIVLEYVPENILELYEAQQYGLKEDQVKCILFQTCLGLSHIHKKGIIHRDIKPENIMINRGKAEVKIIDFGLAIEQEKCITDYVATRWYRAPENLLGTKEYTVAIDIFSLGCVIVELYLGNPLFPGANNVDQISKILSMIEQPTMHSWKKGYEMLTKLGLKFQTKNDKKKITLKTLLSSCSEGLSKIIQKMLVLNPAKRITAEQIVKDPYFKDIQKIIPPHVYDRYLADFKSTRSSMIKDLPKPQKRNQSKQRVRFMSEQKNFGAFSSFKSQIPLNKFQQQLIKQKQQNPPEKVDSSKNLSFENLLPDCASCNLNNLQTTVFKKSGSSSFIKNLITKDYSLPVQQNSTTAITDASSSIKKSIQKYEQNIMKLSTSLKNIKLLKSAAQLQTEKSQTQHRIDENSDQFKHMKSTQMLSFRGFNQPKQKVSMKQSVSTFSKKNQQLNEQKLEKGPVKNKKVMEYLQKFQTIANQSNQFQKPKLQNSRSEPIIYHSINGTPKKPQLLIKNGVRNSGERQMQENGLMQNSFTNNSFRMNSNEKTSFYHNQSSDNLVSQSVQRDYPKMNESQNIRSQDVLYSPSPESQLRKSLELQKPSFFQSSQRHSMQQPMVKFSNFIHESFEAQSQYVPAHGSIHGSRVMVQEPKSNLLNYTRTGQAFFNEPKNMNSSNYLAGPRNIANGPEVAINLNRPIQNKIKLIAVRDNLSTNVSESIQTLIKTPASSANNSRNPSYYQSSSSFMEKSRPNLGSYPNLQSPEKQAHYIRSSQQMQSPDYQIRHNGMRLQQQTTKHFKSLEHREFYSKKSPSNRYSANVSQNLPNIGYPKNYLSLNEMTVRNQSKTIQQKNHQTTLSQLRQSITGLTQTLNEGVFLSERSEKHTSKDININLNLNIYEKCSAKKR